ncbi:MAG TPA: gas vesicle protein [Longimicrobiaceae bacterium]
MAAEDARAAEEDGALGAELDLWESSLASGEGTSLVDLINRVLDKGVVITGNVTISVAGVDLVYLGLSAILTSISAARRRIAADDEWAASEGSPGGAPSRPPGSGAV